MQQMNAAVRQPAVKSDYVEYGGSQMLWQPYLANEVTLFGFILKADAGSIRRQLCDPRLNNPSQGANRFEPAGSFIVLSFSTLHRLSSAAPGDNSKGWFTERECAIWVPMIDCRRERLCWFHPYMFVDNSYAMAVGREVYGYPKSFAELAIPDEPAGARSFTLRTLAVPRYDPDAQAFPVELIRVDRNSNATAMRNRWDNTRTVLKELGTLFSRHGLDVHLMARMMEDLVHRRSRSVFLKQFPDAAFPGKACYQSIVEAQTVITEFREGEWLDDSFDIRITRCDSHPMAADLGLAGDRIAPVAAFFADFDFALGNGVEIWRD